MGGPSPASSAPSPGPLVVNVDGLPAARRAAGVARSLGTSLTLLSAPAAAAHGGAGWFLALLQAVRADTPGVQIDGILDCGDEAGFALAATAALERDDATAEPAIRSPAVISLVFTGPAAAVPALTRLAERAGVALLTVSPPALRLRPGGDPLAAGRDWLAQHDKNR